MDIVILFIFFVVMGLGLVFFGYLTITSLSQKQVKVQAYLAHFSQEPVRVLQAISSKQYASKAGRKLDQSFFEVFQSKVPVIVSSPEGRAAMLNFYAGVFPQIPVYNKRSAIFVITLVPYADPKDNSLVDLALHCYAACFRYPGGRPSASSNVTDLLYASALQILEKWPNQPHFKRYALEVGRIHYQIKRNGPVSVYDESAIQNDIFVRMS